MEKQSSFKESGKKGVILKTLDRCRSLAHSRSKNPNAAPPPSKTKSWPRFREFKKPKVAPEGYLALYVGPGKERFMIKMECLNHPLFRELLDEAEMVYGLNRGKALELPCDVDGFHRVLWDIEQEVDERARVPRWSFSCRRAWGNQKLSQYSFFRKSSASTRGC